MNRIIFGGAFDPVHNGHINMAEKAAKTLQGEVVFVPARISVWKESSAPVSDKINMLQLALKGKEHLSIDEYEVNSGKDINYSIDTVRYFKDRYPNDDLYYLIGVDQVNEFHRWKDAKELSTLAKIVYFTRPGYEPKQDNIIEYNMRKIEGGGIDVDSTDIRHLKEYNVPDEVLLYIVEHDLYEGMSAIKAMLNPHRFNHSKSVAKLAYQIAKANNVKNPLDVFMAGFFHDLGKGISFEQQKELTKKNFPEYAEYPEFAYHQFAGAVLARDLFNVTDKDMLDAIKYHATGNENMSQMAKIIYASDKIEPTRGFDSTDLINAMLKDVNQGFKIVLQANKDYLQKNNKSIENPLTYNCFKQYL